MNNPFKAATNFINRYKKEEWFRAVVIIIIVTVITVFGVSYKRYRAEKEKPPDQSETEQAEESLIENIWNDSKLHLAVFVLLSAALLAVEHNKNRLKQTGGKEEK